MANQTWTVNVAERELASVEADGAITTRRCLELSRELPASHQRLAAAMAREADVSEVHGPLPFRDGIAEWAGQAERALSGELRDGRSELIVRAHPDGLSLSDRRDFVRADVRQVQAVAVVPTQRTDRELSIRLNQPPDREASEWLEWRAYVDPNMPPVSGIAPVKSRSWFEGSEGSRFSVALAGVPAIVVASVFRLSAVIGSTPKDSSDPTWGVRLSRAENRRPDLAKAWRRERGRTAPEADTAIVLVHGTFSTCIDSFEALEPAIAGATVLRFEHDTFKSIFDNAEELRKMVERVRAKKVVVLGYSRGGLVARLAMATPSSRPVAVVTFGTPHSGTPTADAANGGLRLLAEAGAMCVNGVPVVNALTAALTYALLPQGTLPTGIRQMQPGADFLRGLRLLPEAKGMSESWAGNYAKARGFGSAFLSKMGKAAFGEASDLVIPTKSAMSWGSRSHELKDCAHFGYFAEAEVRRRIQALQAPASRRPRR